MNPNDPSERLDSWKQIAAYLGRDVRTVQRWERAEALPVHRHQHDKLGSVYAFRSELSRWLTARERLPGAPQGDSAKRIKLGILPFTNLGGNDEDYFSDGLTDEMIAQVTRLRPSELTVIARDTAMRYKATDQPLDHMRKELGVDYVLEGRVRRAANRVRITAHLTAIEDRTHVWAETYERDLQDILAVQADIAQAIGREVGLALKRPSDSGSRGKVDPAAFDAYLRAKYHLQDMSASGISKSIEIFARATEFDTSYAPAYAGIATAYALLAIAPFDLLPPLEAMPKAEAAARKALDLDDSLAEAHLALALVQHHYKWNWKAAEFEYRRAIELNPTHGAAHLWYSWLLLALGRQEQALREIEETFAIVSETDPHRLVAVFATRAQAYYFARHFERAAGECERALDMSPQYFMLHYILGRACARLGRNSEAIQHLAPKGIASGEIPLMDAALALAHGIAGRKEQVREAILAFGKKRYVPPTYFAMLFAGLGDRERALEWLERAFEERASGLTWLNVEPMLDDLRGEPRLQKLIEQIGLTGA